MRRVGIFGKAKNERVSKMAAQLARVVGGKGAAALVESALGGSRLPEGASVCEDYVVARDCELAVVLGGDGTLIRVVRLLGDRQVPIFGVNMGALGYLTAFTTDEAEAWLGKVLEGAFSTELRDRLRVRIVRENQTACQADVLNDVVVNVAGMSRIIEIEAYVAKARITTYRADGLIVATPTGSTAYSLSAGGPIVVPEVPAVVLTPICPHTLTMRPLVLPGDLELELRVVRSADGVQATFDGQVVEPIGLDDRLVVTKSNQPVVLVRPPRDTFQILRTKLGWGSR